MGRSVAQGDGITRFDVDVDFHEGFFGPALQRLQMAEETHTDYEVAIEREMHGALPAPEAAQLAEHLLGCATCRAYQRTAMEIESSMAIPHILGSTELGIEKLSNRIRARLKSHQFLARGWISPVVLFVCSPLLVATLNSLYGGHQSHTAFMWKPWLQISLPFYFLWFLFEIRSRWRHLRGAASIELALASATGNVDDLVTIVRRDLEDDARNLTRALIVSPFIALAVALWFAYLQARGNLGFGRSFAIFGAPWAILGVFACVSFTAIPLYSIRRQIAKLGRGSQCPN